MVQETSMKKLHSEEIKEPYSTLNRTEQTTLNKNWVKNSHRKEKITTTKSTPLLRTNSLGKSVKKAHSEDRKELYNTLNRTEHTTSKNTEWKMATENKREEKKHSIAKEPYKSAKKKKKKKRKRKKNQRSC